MASKNDQVFLDVLNRFAQAEDKIKNPKFTKRIGNEIKEQIRKRTRLRKGLTNKYNGSTVILPLLSEKYIDQREFYDINLSTQTSPARSNLTATGQLLEAMRSRGLQSRAEITIKDSRTRTLDGSPVRIGNNKLVGYLEDQGRVFFGLAKFEKSKFQRLIKNSYLKFFRNISKN